MNRGDYGAVWEWNLPFLEGLDRYVIAELSPQLVGLARYQEIVHGDQFPLAVAGWHFDSVNWGGLSVGLSRCGGHERERAG